MSESPRIYNEPGGGEFLDPIAEDYPRPWEEYEASKSDGGSIWEYGLELLKIATSIPFTAFSADVREVIFKRDRARCQDCGKRWKDGWMLHCAHNSGMHDRNHPSYNHPSSGRLLCVDCHQEQHERLLSNAKRRGHRGDIQKHDSAVRLLRHTDRRRKGFGTLQKVFSIFSGA